MFDYREKGVFMAVERDPSKTPFSDVMMSDSSGERAWCSRVEKAPRAYSSLKSFHSFSSMYLYSKLYVGYFGYTGAEKGKERENDNMLVVDVIVREATSTMSRIAETSNGFIVTVGTFTVEEVEYELSVKCVDFSTLLEAEDSHILTFTKTGNRTAQLPMRLDTPYSFLAQLTSPNNVTCTAANGEAPTTRCYTLYSGEVMGAVSKQKPTLLIDDEDHKERIAFYIGNSLAARVEIEREKLPCCTGICELMVGGKRTRQGVVSMTPAAITIYNEIDMRVYSYVCTIDTGVPTSLEYEGEHFTLVGVAGWL